MWYDVFINLMTTLICAVVVAAGKAIWQQIKANRVEPRKSQKPNKKLLTKQFFGALLTLVASLVFAYSFPANSDGALRTMALFVAGLSFIVTWGAFEEAMAFYPPDNITDKPSDSNSGNDADT